MNDQNGSIPTTKTNGDPNTVRDDVLGALALIEATIGGMSDSPDKLRLAFAAAALQRANDKLRACTVCDGYGCDLCGDNVVRLDTFSRKVPDVPALRLAGGFACNIDESGGAA